MSAVKNKKSSYAAFGSTFTVIFILLIIVLAAWWYFLLPAFEVEALQSLMGVVSISLAAVLGILVVGNIFAFSKVDDARKKLRKAKPGFISLLKDNGDSNINILHGEILAAIFRSDSVEERVELLDKLYDVSILCGVVNAPGARDKDYISQLKTHLVKNGYNDKYNIDRLEDYILGACIDETMFFSFIEELATVSGYADFEKSRGMIEQLKNRYFTVDGINEEIWIIRGGAETNGLPFRWTIISITITIIFGFMFYPFITGNFTGIFQGLWSLNRIIAGIHTTLGTLSILLLSRYILRAVCGRY
ncbi:MAG: hypothetical protein ACOYEJ_05160 [Mahellales bacterium]|jgi:hypothetical protein